MSRTRTSSRKVGAAAGRWLCAAVFFAIPCLVAGAPTQEQVADAAGLGYAQRIASLRASHQLNVSRSFTSRVQRIARTLIQRAAIDYPETADWRWEVHTTPHPDQTADCMAGGKLLVGQAYVDSLELNDAELAMLLAHEIEHAALRHNLKEYEYAMRIDTRWAQRTFADLSFAVDNDSSLMRRLAPLNFEQEREADREGLLLAWRAGWQPAALASFFRKIMRDSWSPNFDTVTHPSPGSRWRAARTLALELEGKRL